MEVNLDIEVFDSSCTTTLVIDETVNIMELIDYIQQTFSDKFQGVDIRTIYIRIGGTDEIISPSPKSLREILKHQKKAKLFFQKSPQSGNIPFQQSMSQNNLLQQQPNDQLGYQARNNPQVPQVQNYMNQTQQQQQNSPIGRTINVSVKNGLQQIQVQLDDSVTIMDLIQHFQENMKIDTKLFQLYYGQLNLSVANQYQTLKQLGMQNPSQLEWKHISSINQRAIQNPNMINQNVPLGQNFTGQTQYNPYNAVQQTNLGQQYQQQQQFQQQQFQQQQQMQFSQLQQQQQQYQQQQNLVTQQQQGQIGQQYGNQQQLTQQQEQKSGKQINITFEILDGTIKRQFSTIANTTNNLLELQDAVYQYLGISKSVASIDILIGGTPFGGPKLELSLEKLQLAKDNQTFQVKIRWIGG